jgi:predicted permease
LKRVLLGFFAVMAIACMNLANMQLARNASRRKELAVRLAVGASRFRLVRQMVSEGILLSLLGGIAGFALAYGLSVLKSRFTPPTAVPEELNFDPDWHAGVFVFAVSIVCGIGFSLAPALRATKADLTPAFKESSAVRLPGYRRVGLRNLLMVTQVAGSLMLLLITGFLVVGIIRTSSVETNFDPHTMYLLSIDPVRQGYNPEKAQALFQKLPERLETAGPIHSVALAAQAPFSIEDQDDPTQLTAEESPRTSRVQISALEETVGAGYFAALSQPMLAGREFAELDQRSQATGSKALPVVLNQSAARGFFGNGNAIGERVRDDKQSYEVIGVVHDFRNGLGMSQFVVYLPLTERNFARPPADGITLMVRLDTNTHGGTDALSGIRREIASIDPNLAIFNVRTLSDYLEQSRSSERFAVNTYGGMGIFGLVLAAIGLAGVTACAVAQRRKEIGIRMTLGARRVQVLLLVLREGATLVCVGTVLGFLGGFALAKILSALTSVFVEALTVGTGDPCLLVGAPLLLAVVAMLACYVPARRSARIDPVNALREQ